MRLVIWSDAASEDYLDILRYIAADSPDAAQRVSDAFEKTGNALGQMAIGRHGRVSETYEKSVTGLPYIIVYGIEDEGITIFRVIHTSRDWPDEGWPAEGWPEGG